MRKSFYVSLFCFVTSAIVAGLLADMGILPGMTVVFGIFAGVSLVSMIFAAIPETCSHSEDGCRRHCR